MTQHPQIWPRVSFVLLLPYKRTWVMRPLDRAHRRVVWDASLLRPGIAGGTPESHWKSPWTYFFSKKVSSAAVAPGYAAWPLTGQGAIWADLPELRPVVLERHEFWEPEQAHESRDRVAYLAIHFSMDGADVDRIELSSKRFRRPGEEGQAHVTDLCRRAGVALKYGVGGYAMVDTDVVPRWGADSFARPEVGSMSLLDATPAPEPGQLWDGPFRLHSNNSRSHVISFVGSDADFASPPTTLRDLAGWTPRQTWLYQLATGMNRERFFHLPPSTTAAAAEGVFHRGSATCRAELDGLAIITDPILTAPQNVHDLNALQLLAHGRILDIVMLALRQRAWLDRHTEDLARPVSMADARARVADIVERENELVWFRNSRWFTEVPGRPEATSVLRQLQARLETPQLLDDAREEQQDLLRAASLVRQQTQLEEAEQADRAREITEFAVAALAPPSLILSLGALFGGPGLGFGVGWLVFAIVVGVVSVLAVRMVQRRRSRQRESAPIGSGLSADW